MQNISERENTSLAEPASGWTRWGGNALALAGGTLTPSIKTAFRDVEHQATTLSLYAIRIETHFRSPQLDLWRLSDTEWLLALRRPEPVARPKPSKIVVLAEQLLLPEFEAIG